MRAEQPHGSPESSPTREDCLALDRSDSLAWARDEFVLPRDVIYLDGNSLGAMPKVMPARIDTCLREEWGNGLIRSWQDAGWIDAPMRVGAKIAPLVGADPGEVIVTDSTSINVYKLLFGALHALPGRTTILTIEGDFPTDSYVAEGLIRTLGKGHRLLRAKAGDLQRSVDSDTAVVLFTHVDYRTGRMHNVAEVTRAAHAHGALVLCDLSHSAGAVPVDLEAWGVDLAVGCGYKYLNGGPGAPAFLYVRRGLQDVIANPLTGWMGHADTFAFADAYVPATGIRRYLCGAPVILGVDALECALDAWAGIRIADVRAKSIALTELFIQLVDGSAELRELSIVSPREPADRGSQVTLQHEASREIVGALSDRLVLTDYRPPDLIRFGFAPLYLRFVDVWDAVRHLSAVMTGDEWQAKRGAPLRFVP